MTKKQVEKLIDVYNICIRDMNTKIYSKIGMKRN